MLYQLSYLGMPYRPGSPGDRRAGGL
jgi:hypothetical protein